MRKWCACAHSLLICKWDLAHNVALYNKLSSRWTSQHVKDKGHPKHLDLFQFPNIHKHQGVLRYKASISSVASLGPRSGKIVNVSPFRNSVCAYHQSVLGLGLVLVISSGLCSNAVSAHSSVLLVSERAMNISPVQHNCVNTCQWSLRS